VRGWLFAGLRAPNSDWELTLFGKNVAGTGLQTYGGNIVTQSSCLGPMGSTANSNHAYMAAHRRVALKRCVPKFRSE
jgi:hypothetical protein